MCELPAELFADPVWHALGTRHRHFALIAGDARRYTADVAPFAAVGSSGRAALDDLRSLLSAGEALWIASTDFPQAPGLNHEATLECVQMALPVGAALPAEPAADLRLLTAAEGAAMVGLTDLAFPGFFRRRTHEMGRYYGVFASGELIAMGGERLLLDGYSELSAICTHPAHRGKGLAASIIRRLVHDHREQGVMSYLHVGAANRHAIGLYRGLGFREIRRIVLHRLRCTDRPAERT